jgi:hypothetical protein
MQIAIRYTIKNVGNYPASNIWIDADVNITSFGTGEHYFPYFQNLIKKSETKKPVPAGRFLFPKEEFSITYKHDKAAAVLTKAMTHVDGIIPIIVGCVRYDFGTSPDGHHTAFVRELVRTNPSRTTVEKGRNTSIVFPDEGKIETRDLAIRGQDSFISMDDAN